MRKIFLIIGFSLFLLSGCEEESNDGDIQLGELPCNYTDFRYYHNEIITLENMSKNYVLIGVDTAYSDNSIRSFVKTKNYFDSDHYFEINSSANYGYKYMTVKLIKSCNCEEIAWIINEIKENLIISFAHYTTQTDYCTNLIGESIGDKCVDSYSNMFYIKVFDTNDISDLNAVVNETNTEIVEQLQFMNDWYKLKADKYSNGDALQMANYFHETGLFSAVDYDFIKVVVE